MEFDFFLLRWTDGRTRGADPDSCFWDGRSGLACFSEDAKQYKTRRGAEQGIGGLPLEVVTFTAKIKPV